MQHINPRQPGFQRPAPQPVDLRNYDGFQWESRRASQHPALPPKPPRPQQVQPYVPSQPGYQGEALKLKEKICLGTVLSWNFRGEFGWIRPRGAPPSGEKDVFCASKDIVGGDLLIPNYNVQYELTEGHRTINRDFVPDSDFPVPWAFGPIAKYAKADQVGRWRDRNGAKEKGYYFQTDPRY